MDYFIVKEFLRETSSDVASFLFIFGVFYLTVNYLRVLCVQTKIEKIERQKEKEIDNIESEARGKDITTVFMNRQIEAVKENYQPQLYKLNRKRKFILERLPFFKN